MDFLTLNAGMGMYVFLVVCVWGRKLMGVLILLLLFPKYIDSFFIIRISCGIFMLVATMEVKSYWGGA